MCTTKNANNCCYPLVEAVGMALVIRLQTETRAVYIYATHTYNIIGICEFIHS